MPSCTVRKAAPAPVSQRHKPAAKPRKPQRISKPKAVTSAQTRKLINEAHKWIGTPYRYGGTTRSGVDCSGLVMELYRSVYDIKLPRSSAAQQEFCVGIAYKDLEPGDLVFFATGRRNVVSHVGLYIGDGRMIHASASRGVMVSGLEEAYFKRNYHSGGRVVQTPGPKKAREVKQQEAPAPPTRYTSPLDSLELIIEQQIDSIYVADPHLFD